MVRDLVESAIDMVRSEREAEVEELAHERVDERLLDLLLPPPAPAPASPPAGEKAGATPEPPKPAPREDDALGVFLVSGSGAVTKETIDPAHERYKRTRDKLKQLLIDGKLEEREVEVEVTPQSPPMFDVLASQGGNEGMDNISDMLKEMLPKRKKKRTVKVSEARRILFEQELEKLIDLEDVTADALDRVEKLGIIFLDEIDKIAGERSQAGGPDVSR